MTLTAPFSSLYCRIIPVIYDFYVVRVSQFHHFPSPFLYCGSRIAAISHCLRLHCSSKTTVTLAQGTLKGAQCTTESGFEYVQFLGVPYAKPPIGELRFKSPQAPEPWQNVRDATATDSNTISCQLNPRTGSIIGSEDCLYLNVFTSRLPVSCSELKPVMVFIHGGGFVSGNGTIKNENGPDYLISNNIVLVTVNYRLGPLGFLCLNIPNATGNMGLKDSLMALQWIQKNIYKFGGDKHNVTIFGVSSGSATCEFLFLSPRAKGLYHKCILESGCTLNPWAINFPKKAEVMALKLAKGLGYKGQDENKDGIYKVLIEAPAPEITSLGLQIADKESLQTVSFGFVPTIEQDFGNGDAFLISSPYKLLKERTFNQVPVIRGFCSKEGTLVCFKRPNTVNELVQSKSFTDYLRCSSGNEDDVAKYNSKFITAYIDNAKLDNKTDEFAIDFFGDLNIVAGSYLAGKLQSNKVPVYMYKFCYDGKLNKFKKSLELKKPGAAHGDEVGYLLSHVNLSSQTLDDDDILIRSRMTKMWTNFAKFGNPTPDNCCSCELIKWPGFTDKCQEYLNIDKKLTVKANYEPEKISIFKEIFDKYKQ